ncbi:MAG: hypothetical protein RMM98_13115 [Acidobacteriota bacterium]|nr:hypothetical protein [Blastocatellia bacterium]MDW8240546.1 hypothetical protein [Acidobacteriota bacterium]
MKKLLIALLVALTPALLAALIWTVPCVAGVLLVLLFFSGPSSLLPGTLVKLALLTFLFPALLGFFLDKPLIGL